MQPLGVPPVPEEYTMHARSALVRGMNTGLPVPCTDSHRSAPARSALAGASVTRTRLTFSAAARAGEALNWRQIGYSVISTLAFECFNSCHCSSGLSL